VLDYVSETFIMNVKQTVGFFCFVFAIYQFPCICISLQKWVRIT